ncbi:MAG: biopolymer transporter ExbD [SAR86 cluster bacterium]|jgi:biopolymer transport protein ExbD|nr:MAG: biopolymer transporter ExbD [SAR86 cluster bacterium]URQ70148.1 biopolymer transporter ExbD [SAR86 cluster bacterium]|tara:strand:- start:41 stop:442 length:402 start_codon:yes stop_codon:yes gene_type:complete
MKFLNQTKSNFSIEITPLIDIVFLLVIFFVVTSKVGDSQFLSLDLPKTESFKYNSVQTYNEITITSEGSVYINDNFQDINNLEMIESLIFDINNDKSIILSVDANAFHLWVIQIMDILNKNGFNEVQIRTLEK